MGLHANKVKKKMGPIKEELSHLEEKKREEREGKSNTQSGLGPAFCLCCGPEVRP